MSDVFARLTARFGLRALLTAVVVLALVASVSGYVLAGSGTSGEYRLTAHFPETPGLYKDNRVEILGVPSGRIVSVHAMPDYVEVVLALPNRVKVPAQASAVLMAPNPVSDRFVELSPAYTTGPVLAHGGVIPMQRSIVPLELDQVYGAVDNLSKMLGPAGANNDGQLSAALHALAELANGNGVDVHRAITAISAALPALTEHPDELQKLITGLDSLTKSLAARSNTINALYDDLATATSELAGERQTIASAITNLQTGLSDVAAFIKANQAHIKGSVTNLTKAVQAVMSQQESLIKAFDVAPLGFQNFDRAFDTSAACPTTKATDCTALFARVDLTQQAFDIVKTYCGNSVNASLLPTILASAKVGSADAADTVCAAEFGLLQGHHGVPGAPSVDLDLAHYLGS